MRKRREKKEKRRRNRKFNVFQRNKETEEDGNQVRLAVNSGGVWSRPCIIHIDQQSGSGAYRVIPLHTHYVLSVGSTTFPSAVTE
jgi:hypothetical protein